MSAIIRVHYTTEAGEQRHSPPQRSVFGTHVRGKRACKGKRKKREEKEGTKRTSKETSRRVQAWREAKQAGSSSHRHTDTCATTTHISQVRIQLLLCQLWQPAQSEKVRGGHKQRRIFFRNVGTHIDRSACQRMLVCLTSICAELI